MGFDVEQWLRETMGFSAEDAKTMAPRFNAEKVEATYVSPADRQKYTTGLSEIEKTRADLKTANDKLNAEMAEWASLTAAEKKQAGDLQVSLEQARVRATQLETRLSKLATDHGLDPKELLEGTVTIPEKKPEPVVPALDPKTVVSLEQFGRTTNFMLDVAPTLDWIKDEHKDLFGTRLDTREIVAEIRARASKGEADIDPIKIWEEKHGVPAKREAVAKAKHEDEIRAAEARGAEKMRTEMLTPGAPVPGRHAPVFGRSNADGSMNPRTSVLKRPQPGATVGRAAAAFRSGKYRQPA